MEEFLTLMKRMTYTDCMIFGSFLGLCFVFLKEILQLLRPKSYGSGMNLKYKLKNIKQK